MSLLSHLNILQCPLTLDPLLEANQHELDIANKKVAGLELKFIAGLVNKSRTWFFPIREEIACLHKEYAVPLHDDTAMKGMEFSKERIYNYFNKIRYHEFEGQQIYDDAKDFVDFRPFLLPYTQHGFFNCRQYLDTSGTYYVDAACGPVAFKEYVQLAEGFEWRVCVDLSLNALIQAKRNLSANGQKALLICGDLTALPLREGIADAVLCQHALFHVPKKLQATALNELVRIARPGKKIAIVYDWFYHSRFMNLALGPYQLYRILRHWAGKAYARLVKRDGLYFYSHGPAWFRKHNPGRSLDFFVWRSFNIHFSRIYLHKKLGGERLVNYIWKLEEKSPRRMGLLGEYPIIVIEK